MESMARHGRHQPPPPYKPSAQMQSYTPSLQELADAAYNGSRTRSVQTPMREPPPFTDGVEDAEAEIRARLRGFCPQLPESTPNLGVAAPRVPSRSHAQVEDSGRCIAHIIAQPPHGCSEIRFPADQPAYVDPDSSRVADVETLLHGVYERQIAFEHLGDAASVLARANQRQCDRSAAPSCSLPMRQSRPDTNVFARGDNFVVQGNMLRRATNDPKPQVTQSRPDLTKATLRNVLEELRGQDNSCVFVCRKINKLGFKAKEALKEHYSQFGKVRQVLVPLSKAKTLSCHQGFARNLDKTWARTRPGNLGLVVMKSKAEVDSVIAQGETQTVKGLPINVQRFEHFHANKELDLEENNMSSSFEDGIDAFDMGQLNSPQLPTSAMLKPSAHRVFVESSVDSSVSTSASDSGFGYFSDAPSSSWSADNASQGRQSAQMMAYTRAAEMAQMRQMQLKNAEAGLLMKMEEALRAMHKGVDARQGVPSGHGTGA